jgi:hypothetical protein
MLSDCWTSTPLVYSHGARQEVSASVKLLAALAACKGAEMEGGMGRVQGLDEKGNLKGTADRGNLAGKGARGEKQATAAAAAC